MITQQQMAEIALEKQKSLFQVAYDCYLAALWELAAAREMIEAQQEKIDQLVHHSVEQSRG